MIRNWHRGGWTPWVNSEHHPTLANAVALLCSADANWITGQILDVDGGASLMNANLPLEIQQVPAARGAQSA